MYYLIRRQPFSLWCDQLSHFKTASTALHAYFFCLQAMDRAHRLGQARTVHVYRLLARATLEERVMSLQRWKSDVVAGALVSKHNASLDAMAEVPLTELLAGTEPPPPAAACATGGARGASSVVAATAASAHGGGDRDRDAGDGDEYESLDLRTFLGLVKQGQRG